MFIFEAGLLLPAHLWLQGQGREKKKKIPSRDFASVESLHANAPPKPNTNAMAKRITPVPSVSIAEKEKGKKKKIQRKGGKERGRAGFPPSSLDQEAKLNSNKKSPRWRSERGQDSFGL